MLILPYTDRHLADALKNSYTPSHIISDKHHFRYLKDYLGVGGVNARTIVVEDDYISKDYLQDYASYYSLCFEGYSKKCKRIHFFDHEFSQSEFEAVLLQKEEDTRSFWEHYLGFIVVKPIPLTVIGFTLLKTYPSTEERDSRCFWGVRNYTVHLFGNVVKLKSLAFQEQDSVLAACATTAIWSMLNKAAADFHTVLKSPSQITQDADSVSHDGSRLFPNKGLDVLQICLAIKNSGLVSEIKQPDFKKRDENGEVVDDYISMLYLKKIINAYAPIGIPIILIVQVPNGGAHGHHAVTVSGHKLSPANTILPQREISWQAANIEKLYAHDDQWGPFARMEFIGEAELDTPWNALDPDNKPTYVSNIVVPLYPKIRISYEDIEIIVHGLDSVLTLLFEGKILGDLVWDVKVDYSENFKRSIKISKLDSASKLQYLNKSLPKYLWIATCYIADFKIMEFTFDATNVSNGMVGMDVILYLQDDIRQLMVEYLSDSKNKALLQGMFQHQASVTYYDFLINRLSQGLA